MRSLKAEVTKKQDEVLDNYLRDHPEYALNDTTQRRGFYHRYMASKELIKEELSPVVNAYEDQLDRQQAWVGKLKWISPAIIVQESMNQLAGNATMDYENYREQVVAFAGTWREHFMPFLYNNRFFTQKDYPDLPTFQFERGTYNHLGLTSLLLVASMALFGLSFLLSVRFLKAGVLSTS